MDKTLKAALLLIFLLFTVLDSFGQDYLPTSIIDQIIKHGHYSLSYSEAIEQAEWVAYKLTASMVSGSVSRTDNFRIDPKIASGSASLADYKGSGFDRGHLCPAGDMKVSHTSMSESFFMSNMSPQHPSFNRGIWKKLESLVRSWALQEQEIIVVTGPVFSSNRGSIGTNVVTVPGYYYKVIYDVTGKQKMIGFILPNEKGTKDLKEYAVSVDKVESVTGIDFFYQMLSNDKEEALESTISVNDWTFTAVSTNSTSNSSSTSSSVQCKGKAKSTGQRCKNKTMNSNGYCHVHQSQAPGYVAPKSTGSSSDGRCMATTQEGTRCKRKDETGSKYYWQYN